MYLQWLATSTAPLATGSCNSRIRSRLRAIYPFSLGVIARWDRSALAANDIEYVLTVLQCRLGAVAKFDLNRMQSVESEQMRSQSQSYPVFYSPVFVCTTILLAPSTNNLPL